MNHTQPIEITRNPGQTVASVVKLFGFRVRGNSVYVFFGGLAGGIFSAVLAYPVHIALAAAVLPVLPIASAIFVRKFIAGKPRDYFFFWLESKLSGDRLKKRKNWR